MLFAKTNDPQLTEIREAVGLAISHVLEDSTDAAYDFWEPEIRACIASSDYEACWRRIQLAAFGEQAFTGPDRICRGSVEKLPHDLCCSTHDIIGLVHLQYHAMTRSRLVKPINPLAKIPAAWGNLFPSGGRLAEMLYKQHDITAFIAGLQVLVISNWVNNHRRLAANAA